jgi:16S rRNA (cytosine1402-N4)-methyltransferase
LTSQVKMPTTFDHHSVLLPQTIQWLCPTVDGTSQRKFIDCTVGGAGHSKAILENHPLNHLLCIDRDTMAIQVAKERLANFANRVKITQGAFADVLPTIESNSCDGILMDLGVSSPQLDIGDRGFSFQKDGPLDMRMDRERLEPASEWLNTINETELANVLYRYGEEPRSRRIAKAIIEGRPWTRTLPLAECIRHASGYKNSRTHPATRSFQAIRIAVNDEMGQLERALPAALTALKSGGRLAVISFHSLEDRVVKHFFKDCTGHNAPKDAYGNPMIPATGKILTRKGIAGSEDPHPRARSARLRILEKL